MDQFEADGRFREVALNNQFDRILRRAELAEKLKLLAFDGVVGAMNGASYGGIAAGVSWLAGAENYLRNGAITAPIVALATAGMLAFMQGAKILNPE